MHANLVDDRAYALRALVPPPRLRLSHWIENNIVLHEGIAANTAKLPEILRK